MITGRVLQLIGAILSILIFIDCKKLGRKKDKYKKHSSGKLVKLHKKYSFLANIYVLLVPVSQFGFIFWMAYLPESLVELFWGIRMLLMLGFLSFGLFFLTLKNLIKKELEERGITP